MIEDDTHEMSMCDAPLDRLHFPFRWPSSRFRVVDSPTRTHWHQREVAPGVEMCRTLSERNRMRTAARQENATHEDTGAPEGEGAPSGEMPYPRSRREIKRATP